MIAALLPALAPILGDALRRLIPDAGARQRAEAELHAALIARAGRTRAGCRCHHQGEGAV